MQTGRGHLTDLSALAWIGVAFASAVASIGLLWVARADQAPSRTSSAGLPAASAASAPTASEAPTSPLSQPRTSPEVLPGDPVEQVEFLLSEPGRPQPSRLEALSSVRTLRTVVRRPSAASRPMPAVVFAHGFDAEPEDYEMLLDTWAAAGYLVAAPELPDSARNLPGEPSRDDLSAQAADLRSVISALLDGRAGPVDPRRVAVAGHSDGGTAVAEMIFTPESADPRVSAYLVLSGATPAGATSAYRAPGAVMIAVGAEDDGNLPAAQAMFAIAGGRAAFVEAPRGDHLSMYVTGAPLGEAVRSTTVNFLALALSGDPSGQLSLANLADDDSGYLTVAVKP